MKNRGMGMFPFCPYRDVRIRTAGYTRYKDTESECVRDEILEKYAGVTRKSRIKNEIIRKRTVGYTRHKVTERKCI